MMVSEALEHCKCDGATYRWVCAEEVGAVLAHLIYQLHLDAPELLIGEEAFQPHYPSDLVRVILAHGIFQFAWGCIAYGLGPGLGFTGISILH